MSGVRISTSPQAFWFKGRVGTAYNTAYVGDTLPVTRRNNGRRAKGKGALHFRPDKGLWVFEVQLPPGAGGKRRRRVFYGKTEAEAKRKAADATARGGGSLFEVDRTTLADYITPWLNRAEKRLRPKTVESYRWAWRHAGPLIGGIRLDRFERTHVVDLYSELERAEESANTIRHVAKVMQTALTDAISDGEYKGANPFMLAARKKPRHKAERGRALSIAEAQRFILAAAHDRLEAAWLLGLTAGLRIGEMFGLQWSDVDLEQRTVFVQRQALLVNGRVDIGNVKTSDGQRLLPIGDLLLEALMRRRDAAKAEPNSMWVFPSVDPTSPVSPNNARRRNFVDTKARAGIAGSFTPHDLRHTFNSIGNAAGITEKVRSELMGHADSAITRTVYTHTIDGQARAAVFAIDSLLQVIEN